MIQFDEKELLSNLEKMPTEMFTEQIAGPDTIAGGGSVSALAGAYGAALMSMVVRVTLGNRKYGPVHEEFRKLLEDLEAPRHTFLRGIQEDVDAFDKVLAALAMPKSTDEEKAVRRDAADNATIDAAEAPLRMAELAVSCLKTLVDIVNKGNTNAGSDSLVGAMMLRSSALGSIYNVRINLNPFADRDGCRAKLERAAELEKEALKLESQIMKMVPQLTDAACEQVR